MYVGYSGSGSVTQSNGGIGLSGCLYLGYNSGSIGVYNLNGTGYLSAGSAAYVGYSGSGSFTQSGGNNNLSAYRYNLYLAYNSGSIGPTTSAAVANFRNPPLTLAIRALAASLSPEDASRNTLSTSAIQAQANCAIGWEQQRQRLSRL